MQIYSYQPEVLRSWQKTDTEYIKHTNSGNPQHFGFKFGIVF